MPASLHLPAILHPLLRLLLIGWIAISALAAATNQPPVVDAGADLTIHLLNLDTITLQGTATDADGDDLTCAWYLVTGPGTIGFADATATTTNATLSVGGIYEFALVASDGTTTASDTVVITVLPYEPWGWTLWLEEFKLDDGTSDDVGPTAWSVEAAGLAGSFAVDRGWFACTATQGEGVWRSQPIAIAGFEPVCLAITVDSIYMPGPDDVLQLAYAVDGRDEIVFFRGEGPVDRRTVIASGIIGSSLQVIVRARIAGQYESYVWDDVRVAGDVASGNLPPEVDAGPDQRITQPEDTVQLLGGFHDPDNYVSLSWSMVSGPGTVRFSDSTWIETDATFPLPGTYELRLDANDGLTHTADTVVITVESTTRPLPWDEDFLLADSTTADDGDTAWSIEADGLTGSFAVRDGRFRCHDTDGEGVWRSAIIAIDGEEAVDLSVAIGSCGWMETKGGYADHLRLAYILDGGEEMPFFTGRGHVRSQTVRACGLRGAILQIVIRAKTTGEDESYVWDDVRVVATPPLPEPGTLPWTEDFSLPDRTVVDVGATAWSLDADRTTGTFAVDDGGFVCRNNDGEGVWRSGLIAIDGAGPVRIGMTFTATGPLESRGCYADWVRVSCIVDDRFEVPLFVGYGRFCTRPLQICGLTGSTLRLVIRARTTGADESYSWDDITVTSMALTVNN